MRGGGEIVAPSASTPLPVDAPPSAPSRPLAPLGGLLRGAGVGEQGVQQLRPLLQRPRGIRVHRQVCARSKTMGGIHSHRLTTPRACTLTVDKEAGRAGDGARAGILPADASVLYRGDTWQGRCGGRGVAFVHALAHLVQVGVLEASDEC